MKRLCICLLLGIVWASAGCRSGVEPRLETDAEVSHAAVARLGLTMVEDFEEFVGTVHSRRKTTLSARVVGDVSAVHVREGDAVRNGQLLMEIDSRDLSNRELGAEAALKEANAALEEVDHAIRAGEAGKAAAEVNLRLASSTLERFTALRERNSVSPHEFDEVRSRQESARAEADRMHAALEAQKSKRIQIQARIEQARSEIDAAKIALGYARILAPFDGVVSSEPLEAGSQAAPGVPLIAIEERAWEIDALVPEARIEQVRPGMPVYVEIPSAGLSSVRGRVTAIVPEERPSARSYTVKVGGFSAPEAAILRSGMFARVRIPVRQREILAAPAPALVRRGQLTGVFVVDESNTIRLRLIKAGQAYGENMEILSGLEAGERIIQHPDPAVKDGVRWQP